MFRSASVKVNVGVRPEGVVFAPDGRTAFVSYYDDSGQGCSSLAPSCGPDVRPSGIARIDLERHSRTKNFSIAANLRNLAITPDGKEILATNHTSVEVIDPSTGVSLKSISVPADYIAPSPDGGTIYVSGTGDNGVQVSAIDVRSGAVRPINFGPDDNISALVASTDGSSLYLSACSDQGDSVIVIDTKSLASTSRIAVPTSGTDTCPQLAITPDGRNLYVAAYDTGDPENSGTLYVIDSAAQSVTDHLKISDSSGDQINVDSVAVAPDGRYAYVTVGEYDEQVYVFDTATNRNVGVVSNASGQVAISPDGQYAITYGEDSHDDGAIDFLSP